MGGEALDDDTFPETCRQLTSYIKPNEMTVLSIPTTWRRINDHRHKRNNDVTASGVFTTYRMEQ